MLELKNISFQVPDEKTRNTKEIGILKDVSLTLEDNQFVVITGPNGGGKSTLAKIIAGIEKPTSGQILFDGQDITDMSITDRAKLGISYAFQQPVRFKGVTVFDLLRLAAGKEISVAGACEYLSKVGLCAKEAFPEVRSKGLRSQRSWREKQEYLFLTNRRLELISGAFRI